MSNLLKLAFCHRIKTDPNGCVNDFISNVENPAPLKKKTVLVVFEYSRYEEIYFFGLKRINGKMLIIESLLIDRINDYYNTSLMGMGFETKKKKDTRINGVIYTEIVPA